MVGQLARKIDTVNNGKWFVPEKISKVIRSYMGKNCAQGYDIPLANPSMCNRMIHREFALEHGLLYGKELFGEDMNYNLKLFGAAKQATTIDEVVYCYETSYNHANSTISNIVLEHVLSGIRSVGSYALCFDAIGRIDWEIDALLGPFEFVLQRFHLLGDEDKAVAFEAIKGYLRHYEGRKEYAIPIAHLMGMELDTLLLLPYPAYQTCCSLVAPAPQLRRPGAPPVAAAGDPKAAVLTMYQNGQIGLRYIIKYFRAWLEHKLGIKRS